MAVFHRDADGYLVDNNKGFRLQGYNDTGLSTIGDIKMDVTDEVARQQGCRPAPPLPMQKQPKTAAETAAAGPAANAKTALDAYTAAKASADASPDRMNLCRRQPCLPKSHPNTAAAAAKPTEDALAAATVAFNKAQATVNNLAGAGGTELHYWTGWKD